MVEDWSSFFATVAQVALGVFTVAFALYQFKQPSWVGQKRKQFTIFVGFGEFWLSALFSLVSMTPAHPWQIASVCVGGLGLTATATHRIYNGVLIRAGDRPDVLDQRILKLAFVSYTVYGAFLLSGLASLIWNLDSMLYVSAFAAVWLILSGSFEAAWHLRA